MRASVARSPAQSRMARDQWSRRLRFRHGFGRDHAAIPWPSYRRIARAARRMVMWSHVSEFLHFGEDDVVSLGAEERAGGQLDLHGADYLREFRLEDGLPVWTYHVRDLVIEKSVSDAASAKHGAYQLPHR